MWITSVKFPISDTVTQDSSGFPTHSKTYREHIPASRKDASRQDELLAMQAGYTVDCTFEVDKATYPERCGYLIDESDGTEYDIKRTYTPDKSNRIILTCEVRQRGKI